MYDTIVVGAGIAGCCTALALHQKGQKVLLVDRSGTAAAGGSGAAGAFVSPKIGKGGPLQALTNEAFTFAKEFYLEYFPDYFHQTGVIRIPKDDEDARKFHIYEAFNFSKYRWVTKDELLSLGIDDAAESFLFPEAGVCDAPELCNAILEHVLFRQFDVAQLKYHDDCWTLFSAQGSILNAQSIVLSTGYQNDLFDMRYMGVKGTWGSRGDYCTKSKLEVSMHKSISVSANINGIVKLGATHVKVKDPCMVCDGKPLQSLEEKASWMVDTSDFKLKETFCGMRSGSKDYFPLVGKVIDVHFMFESCPAIVRGAKPEIKHRDHLYILNGLGGRGFVFAPLMAKWLSELIVEGKEMDKRVDPDRLFLKWARKLKAEPSA
ncbi:FAD-dependent 5-carboxymethylaminomethyl-2-thiouridine(34) oxidoreductase MnmC [Sulfurovum sp. ST-21]|uniref:FAD-dependent 5-carboxymethylaminomethyl-2-thiouridine(34) oxidoreductase MnmC n=1 Tax=Sulfurovum indicum TaxID=2779528 RepID=A0A7M1S857_9BACT|nr:FAD-dependent 5-carboxymethylaminomethyl-2-thiouridine(34) oxidoreductase MnmC [Sulfurovum indicum]QOR62530.1 FAD-dependent 5-carboxymethylaminomethyl-2-thiouridine(34) oxidoreductase MnmC [Sulfurovum indicum]